MLWLLKGEKINKKSFHYFSIFLGHVVTCLVLVLVLISKCEQTEENDLKTSKHGEEKKHVCSIYIYTDPFLWRHIYFLEGKKYRYKLFKNTRFMLDR